MTEELIFIDPLSIGNPYYKQILIVVTTDYNTLVISCFISFFFFFCNFFGREGAPTTYGSSQARGRIGVIAAALGHSHNDARSEPCVKPTPQLMATRDL